MTSIAYYISSHGFGHAARQQPIIKRLSAAGYRVHVRTAAPRKFFPTAASYHAQHYEGRIIQTDGLTLDIAATVNSLLHFAEHEAPALRAAESRFLHETSIQLVVSDMPSLACQCAADNGIPSVLVTHFTWDWVYAHYADDYPQLRPIVETEQVQYRHASHILKMPFAHSFAAIETDNSRQIPLVYNQTTASRAAIRAEFDVPDGVRLVLLSMGGHSWGDTDIRALTRYDDTIFLVTPEAWEQVKATPQQFRPVPTAYPNYHNLIAAADVVVGKAGGSTVSEAIGHRTPMIYTTLPHWREAALLHEAMQQYGTGIYVLPDEFQQGAWVALLDAIRDAPSPAQEIRRDGAAVAAGILADYAPQTGEIRENP